MQIFIITGMWIVFALLGVYILVAWKKDGFEEGHIETIRKIWYLIYILGSLVFLTNDPETLFGEWKHYLIALVAFVLIDSLLFLNLYISKFGGQELTSTKLQVGITQEELDVTIKKTSHIPKILTSFEFRMYNIDKEAYILQLERLLEKYGSLEDLVIDLIPYGTLDEQEYLLENMGRLRNKAKRFLSQQNSLASPKDKLALYPFQILDHPYVVQVQTLADRGKVTEVDGNAITTLIIAYNLTVNENINEGGGD